MSCSSLRLFLQPPWGLRAPLLPPHKHTHQVSKCLHMTWQPSHCLSRLPKSNEAALWPGLNTPWLGRAPWTRASPRGDLLGAGSRAGEQLTRARRASIASLVQRGTAPGPLFTAQPGAGVMWEVQGDAGGLGDALHPVLHDICKGREVLRPDSSRPQ